MSDGTLTRCARCGHAKWHHGFWGLSVSVCSMSGPIAEGGRCSCPEFITDNGDDRKMAEAMDDFAANTTPGGTWIERGADE